MAFTNFILTKKGEAYLAKSQTGKQIVFTKGKYGTGTIPAGQSMYDLTDLVTPLGTLPISSQSATGSVYMTSTQFSNKKADGTLHPSFHWMEAGLFAKIVNADGSVDPDFPETLCMYTNASDTSKADYIPGSALQEYILNWPLTISAAANVTAIIDTSLVYPTKDEFYTAVPFKAMTEGTGTALKVSLPTGTTIKEGTELSIKLTNDLEAGSTISANNGPAHPVYTADGNPVSAGVGKAGSYISMLFNDTTKRWYVVGDGGMSSAEKIKLAGIETGANKYVHPTSHSISIITETDDKKVMTAAERTKLEGMETGATKYVHPDTHPVSMITGLGTAATKNVGSTANDVAAGAHTHSPGNITQDANNRFITDVERTKLQGIEEAANKYSHPPTHAASIIVQDPNYRFFTDAERTKLQGVADGAEANVQPNWNEANTASDTYIQNKPTALKNPSALTVQLNGSTKATYDGSTANTVNITAGGIGAESTTGAQQKVNTHNSDVNAHADLFINTQSMYQYTLIRTATNSTSANAISIAVTEQEENMYDELLVVYDIVVPVDIENESTLLMSVDDTGGWRVYKAGYMTAQSALLSCNSTYAMNLIALGLRNEKHNDGYFYIRRATGYYVQYQKWQAHYFLHGQTGMQSRMSQFVGELEDSIQRVTSAITEDSLGMYLKFIKFYFYNPSVLLLAGSIIKLYGVKRRLI